MDTKSFYTSGLGPKTSNNHTVKYFQGICFNEKLVSVVWKKTKYKELCQFQLLAKLPLKSHKVLVDTMKNIIAHYKIYLKLG